MLHRKSDEGDQEQKPRGRPRGRPFQKGHFKGKVRDEVLDDSGHEISDGRGTIAPVAQSLIVEPANDEFDVSNALNKVVTDLQEKIQTETQEKPMSNEPPKEGKDDLQIMDKIEFTNGHNKLTIRFSKKHNRMFRIQVFLNDESEIRPVTYTGASTGYAFWNLLKGALKK